MKILLDTQALILAGRDELPVRAARAFCSPSNQVFFTLISLWEMGIKASLGRLELGRPLTEYHALLLKQLGLLELPLSSEHIEKAVLLPFHHKDPFDRLIIGQALAENLSLMSSDSEFAAYGCKMLWD